MPVGQYSNINSESTPVIDGWGYGDYWGAQDWIFWHGKLKQKYGLAEANRIFISHYLSAGFGAASYDWRTFNQAFRSYAKENNFYNALWNGLDALIKPLGDGIEIITEGSEAIENAAESAGEAVVNVSSSISGGTKTLKYIIPIAVLAVAVGAFFFFNNKYKLIKF